MSLMLTSTTTVLTLNDPKTVNITISKKVETIYYTDGTDMQRDKGKTVHGLTITGLEYNDTNNSMEYINNMMDNQDVITVSGLGHNDLDTNYIVSDFNFKREEGEPNSYYYTLILERIRDE